MSMQRYSSNPIEQRKIEVRRHSRNTVLAGGGTLAAFVGGLVMGSNLLMVIAGVLLIATIVSGFRVSRIINHRDEY